MLTSLKLRDIGPAPRLGVELADRLNLFTGDNGLGKTFLLDIAWWALTGDWAGRPAWPRPADGASPKAKSQPQIKFQLTGTNGRTQPPIISRFHFQRQEWIRPVGEITQPGLIIYARVDGGFSLWDPARKYALLRFPSSSADPWSRPPGSSFHFTAETLWNGLSDNGAILCNGLIRDWVAWQNQPRTTPFEILKKVVGSLAPSPDEPIEIGPPVRLSTIDVRDIPTLTLPYGDVPVVHASAGMKRIISFAYLLTWAWDEHKRAAHLRNQPRAKQILFLVDELEAHLHPRWQRTLLPSILKLADALEAEIGLQVLATTHAPLVLASVEPYWDEGRDSLFVFEFDASAKHVSLRALDWAKQGDAVGWLTSPVFGLEQARSREAERAIEAAEAFMRGDRERLPPGLKTRAAIQRDLERFLPGLDPFWPRWIVGAKQ
jgi:hypothetical protein